MISYRQADLVDKIKSTDAPIGIVRIVCHFFGNNRCVTAYLVESLTSDMVKKEALIKFTDDLWSSLPAVITNSYQQSPMGFSTAYKYDHILTMVSENSDGFGLMPSPDFITTAIETKFKAWGIKNEIVGNGTVNSTNGWLDSQYSIRWVDIPDSFKPRKADLFDNMNRKKEWKQHRVDRAVNFLFDIWERFWGRGNEHSAGELYSTLTGNLANKAIQQSFIRVVRDESEVTFEEAQGFLKDPEMKPLFLKKFLEVARSKGEYDNDSIRNADLIDRFKHSEPIEFRVNFRIYLENKQLAFKSIQHPQGESFTPQMQEKRDYIEKILVGILNGKGFYPEDNNWVKDYSINAMFPAAIGNLYGIMEALKDRDDQNRITYISEQLIDDGSERYSFKVVVK